MYYYRQLLSLLSVLTLLSVHAAAQPGELQRIDSLMRWANGAGMFNGAVLASEGDRIIYNAAFGFTDAGRMGKLTPDYRFNIGSITKEFSAVALMQLKEQGKLKLSDKVSTFIPELGRWADTVTIRDLLQFTSGIPDIAWKRIKNDSDLFEGLMQIDTLKFRPGARYDYNSNNIFLRHFIVERITKMPFKAYVGRCMFGYARMDSALMTPLADESHVAGGFNKDGTPDKADLAITGGGYLTTTDLFKWATALHGNKMISRRSLYELGQAFDSTGAQSALGNAAFRQRRLTRHRHHGRSGSFEALLVSEMDKGITVVLLTNSYRGRLSEISDAIIAILSRQAYSLLGEK